MRVLLLTPPMTQLNTPYPATAYLTGFLRSRGVDAVQADPALELFLRLFSRAGLERVGLGYLGPYLDTVEAVVRFLQGRDPSLAMRIVVREYLPEGPRFAPISSDDGEEQLGWAFGGLGTADRAKYLASLYIDDLADAVRSRVDARFELARYGEKLASSAPTFDPLRAALDA